MKRSEKAKGKEPAAEKKGWTTYYAIAGAAIVVVTAVVLFFVLNPATIKAGDTVAVIYVGTLSNGSVFYSNVNKTPLTFVVGAHTVIPGFEDAVVGMSKDQVKTVYIPVDRAYGPYRSDLVITVNRSMFLANAPLNVGEYYQVTSPTDGSVSVVKVLDVTQDTVTIDQNHMLAGQDLTFMIRIIDITPAK